MIVTDCLDCGDERRFETVEAVLKAWEVCGMCFIQRGIADYADWCGAIEVEYDAESADEYLSVTDYGSSLPEWIQVRVKEFAMTY